MRNQNRIPAFYKRYVDDTLSKMPDVSSASEFLLTLTQLHNGTGRQRQTSLSLNEIYPSLSFTMGPDDNGKLPFLRGMVIIRNGPRLDTKAYVKPTDTGLLLHYQSHVDVKYKHSLLKTIWNRAFELSSNWQFFHQECARRKMVFAHLHYPETLIENTTSHFIEMRVTENVCSKQHVSDKLVYLNVGNSEQCLKSF